MNVDELTQVFERSGERLDRIGESRLRSFLQPVREKALVVQVREMTPEDHAAVMLAKGIDEHDRLMAEADRLEAKHGRMG